MSSICRSLSPKLSYTPFSCGSIACGEGKKIRLGQLSMIAGAIEERWISAKDWVAKTTETFFLRNVLSPSRMRLANIGSSKNPQASSKMSQVGEPSNWDSNRWKRYVKIGS